MPLYRKRPKRAFLSQDVPAKKILPFKQPDSSQKAIEDVLEMQRELKSPICPEVFPRSASEPNESASDNFKYEKGNSIQQKPSREIKVPEDFCELQLEKSEISSEFSIAIVDESKSVSIKTDDNSFIDKLSQSKEEKGLLKKNHERKKNEPSINNTIRKKIKLSKSRNETSHEDIFPEISIASDPTDKKAEKSSYYRDLDTQDYRESLLDTSLASSVSSQISINHPPVKEAFKNFLIQKEIKKNLNNISSQNSDISLNDPLIKQTYTQFITKKDKFCRVNTPKGITHYAKMKWLQEQRIVGVYVHCDKCDKIRYLEEIQDPTLLPDKWYCKNNTDREFNNCDIREEKFPAHIQEDWIDNLYNAGSLVWAKLDGYPWWPAMVEDDPDTESYYWLDDDINNTPSYYHVSFFDKKEVTRAWLKPQELKSFYKEKSNPNFLPSKFSIFKHRINFAINQANDALNMSLKERLEKFSFLSRYKKPINKPKDINDSENKNSKFTKNTHVKGESSKVNNKDNETQKRKKINNKDNKIQKRKKINNKNKKFQKCDFLMGDFEIPSSSTIENISFELFEDI